jgi:NAD(P)-dependent dehydrogenase (short-subunit alcohol dehydrogenase family)
MDALFDLAGRRALVTGGGQNLGEGIARTLGRIGAHVVINDLVEERAQAVADEIVAGGGSASIALFDVTDFDAVMAGIDAAGPIDILVNNAGNAGAVGWAGDGPFVGTTPADWSAFFAVNLYGVMHCVRAVTPSMMERQWGRIVTIISDAARTGESNMAAYAAAKAGAAGFTRAYAREVGRYDITANNIAIGTMHRPTSDTGEANEEQARRMKEVFRRYIVRRQGEPEEIAGLVAYLASPLGAWVSGQTYPVNGGYSIGL